MLYYDLETSTIQNEWVLILKGKGDENGYIVNTLTDQKLLQNNTQINLTLVNNNNPEDQKTNPFDLDMFYWKDDLMEDAENPRGSYIVVSRDLALIFKNYNLPSHKFYPVNIYNPYSFCSKGYLLLFLFGSKLKYTDFSKCKYALKNRPYRKIVDILGPNLCNSLEELNLLREEYLKERLLLDFHKQVITVNYDILWGIANVLTISEPLRDAIEEGGFKGIQTRIIKEPTYIIPENI